MVKTDAYRRGEAFSAHAGSYKRPLFLIAHQDDELGYAGLIQRLGPKTRFVWLTNGDGLYFESDLTPPEYAEVRKAEAVNAVGVLGISAAHTACLDFSEADIYRRLSQLHAGTTAMPEQMPFFTTIRDAVRKTIFEMRPDIVFTCAYQGGHPEHDLTHFFTRRALDDYARETGIAVPFFHLPEYEYTILLAFRFHPLYRARVTASN
ncbi:MAG: PIG-L family deacetylase [Deltaproteobacteria bacterium]|nr:PIG-L family deacetylase [Deltaproteobacteria bacterium]